MPKVAAAKTKLMIKERGGKAQVAFRNALGLCESEDLQFQQIKRHIRALAIKHFEIGLKPREQEKHCKDRFLNDVHKAYPVFRRDNRANAHLLTYVDRYLHAKAVPSSRFHRRVRLDNDDAVDDVLGEDDKSDASSECPGDLVLGPLYHEEATMSPVLRPWSRTSPGPEPDEKDEHSETFPSPFSLYPYGGHRRSMVQKETGVTTSAERSPSPILAGQADLKACVEWSPEIRSPSLNLCAEMPLIEEREQTALREHFSNPGRMSSMSQTLFSDNLLDASPVKAFLNHAQLSHLFDEFVKLGIKTQSRLHLIAAWPECDIEVLLRDSVRESRIDKFEALQLNVAFRSLRRSLVSLDVDDKGHLH